MPHKRNNTLPWRVNEILEETRTDSVNFNGGINQYVFIETINATMRTFRYTCLLDCFRTTAEAAWNQHTSSVQHQNSVQAYESASRGVMVPGLIDNICQFQTCTFLNGN